MRARIQLQNRSYYWEAIKQHRRTVALIITSMITLPLFAFTSLPPVEVTEKIVHSTVEEIEVPIEVPVNVSVEVPIEVNQTIEVEVNKTIEVEVNITKEVVVNTTIGVNITEGGSKFLEPQPPPPLIDTDIVLCIDTSGSMNTERMAMAKAAIISLLEVLNQTNSAGFSHDRVALVSFAGEQPSDRDGNWSNDAFIHADLDYIENKSHLEKILNETNTLEDVRAITGTYTDAWAGLNLSLDLLLKNQRDDPALTSIIFLTDGRHNLGPWSVTVSNNNYTGFLSLPANFSDPREGGPFAESPIVKARENDVKIYSIGLFQGSSGADFDEDFLRNISLHPTLGTNGDFFTGNDTLSLTESFLRARDSASGWTPVNLSEISILDNGSQTLFSFNASSDIRRLKWDVNWNNSLVDFNLSIKNPNGTNYITINHANGTMIEIITNLTQHVIPLEGQQPKSVIFNFPTNGLWHFNISWRNISTPELIKARLSSYQPPIFIESLTRENTTAFNETQEDFLSQSVIFLLNATNKNPIFSYHNITPYLLVNLTGLNVTLNWDPPEVSQVTINNSVLFTLNLTFLEPTLLQGDIVFKINCSEGYYDAIAQSVTLDYRITTQNVTVESHLENQTITVTENHTISVIENQTITTIVTSTGYELRTQISYIPGTTNVLQYTYDRQMFDTLKWIGFFATLALIMSFLVVYIMSQAYHLKNLANKVRGRFFQDQAALELALRQEGITIAPADLSSVMMEADDLDQLGESIFNLTGKQLSPEDMIRIASGTNIDKVAERISYVTGMAKEEILSHLRDAPSIEVLIQRLNLDSERFRDIIARDEDVLSFQKRISNLMTPITHEMSGIRIYDDFDVDHFRSRLRKKLHS
ncbi:MAG: VWA domain-containing protein [Candidatus Heimdallarchaeota archaeon]|nr:MAG: VWA domain-containing protein [Candidatus Heimdallarchaeota archaeon]